ncbi:MAG: Crp/Fnr family transcriptional regulator [Bacteroidota bacterium]|nr:Crp/Fnr family transcriptional regulator [Bacteroidota bacterium]
MLSQFKKYIQEKTKITDGQFDIIATDLVSKKIKKDTQLLREGDVCSQVFFVAKGLLRAYTIDSFGKEHIIQFGPEDGWVSDRNSFYFNEPAMFYVDAIEDSEIVFINKEFYEKAEKIIPGFNSFSIMILHNFIRFMQKRISLLLGATAEQRYLDFIELYPRLTLRVPQWMIASYLGITPESLSRVRKELATKNFKQH